jgi:hypothetical protein
MRMREITPTPERDGECGGFPRPVASRIPLPLQSMGPLGALIKGFANPLTFKRNGQ